MATPLLGGKDSTQQVLLLHQGFYKKHFLAISGIQTNTCESADVWTAVGANGSASEEVSRLVAIGKADSVFRTVN